MRCKGTNSRGERCGARAEQGGWCRHHQPESDVIRANPQHDAVLVVRPSCPSCGTTAVQGYRTSGPVRYYHCRKCCTADGDWTRFKTLDVTTREDYEVVLLEGRELEKEERHLMQSRPDPREVGLRKRNRRWS